MYISILSRLVSELAELSTMLMAECELAVKFEKEYEELHVWLTDTRSMLEVTGSPSSASGSIMGVPASAALLRGKHQVSRLESGFYQVIDFRQYQLHTSTFFGG